MYYRDNTTSYRSWMWGGVVIALIIIAWIATPIPRGVQHVFQKMNSSWWGARFALAEYTAREITLATHSKRSIYAAYQQLKKDHEHAQALLVAREAERLQYEFFNAHTNPQRPTNTQARVLVSHVHNPYGVMIIGQGSDDNVRVGDAVSFAGQILIGHVVQVFARTAYVRLITDTTYTGEGMLPESELVVTVSGGPGNTLRFDAPRDVSVTTDTLIIDRSTGLVSGVVGSVIFDPRSPVQSVIARMPLDVRNVSWVSIHPNPLTQIESE